MLSTGLIKLMPDVESSMSPTSVSFFGVGENRMTYCGMLYNVNMQLAENMVESATIGVY